MLDIYKASAGSGKTFTLAYRYIKLLLGVKNPETGAYSLRRNPSGSHRSILAITFTNKATEEMKRRIVRELAILAGIETTPDGKPSPSQGMLIYDFGCSPQDLRDAAATALRSLLLDFNFFNVSTIDSFFQTILRTFAREAELTGNYELELDSNEAIKEGTNRFFSSLTANSGSPLTRRHTQRLADFLVGQFQNGDAVMLFSKDSLTNTKFVKLISGLSDETFLTHYPEIMAYFADPKRIDRFESQLRSHEKKLWDKAKTLARQAVEAMDKTLALNPKDSPFYVHFANALRNFDKYDKVPAADSKTLPDVVATDGEKAINAKFAKFLASHPDFPAPPLPLFVEAADAILKVAVRSGMLRSIRVNLFHITLMAAVYSHIEDYRNENNAVLLSDTNSLLSTIIADEDVPFVYERLGLRLHNYLIDEFQDTSRLQWTNLLPLVRESVSTGNDSLIIGDEKQCIYRFRNADPTLLQREVGEAFPAQSAVHGAEPAENTNWRSAPTVIDFNNALFDAIAAGNDVEDVYGNVRQAISPKNSAKPGYVAVTAHDTADADEYDAEVLSALADEIDAELAAGYRPADIAILVRRKQAGQKIISYLMTHMSAGLSSSLYSIISDDLIELGNSQALRLVVSRMRSMLNTLAAPPREKEEDADRRPSPVRYKTPLETLRMMDRYESFRHSGASPADAIAAAIAADEETPETAAETADTGLESATTLIDLVEDIINTLPTELLTTHNSFISAFVDLVTEFCAHSLPDLRSFLRYWDTTGKHTVLSAPDDPDALRIMTIHKSKGLEFPCVHVPYAQWPVPDFKDVEWFDSEPLREWLPDADLPPLIPLLPAKSMAGTPFEPQYLLRCREELTDEVNSLYVAFTRAKECLTVHYAPMSGNKRTIGAYIEGAIATVWPQALVNSTAAGATPEKEEQKRAPGEYPWPTLVLGEMPDKTVSDKKTRQTECDRQPYIPLDAPTESLPMPPYFSHPAPESDAGFIVDTTPDAL